MTPIDRMYGLIFMFDEETQQLWIALSEDYPPLQVSVKWDEIMENEDD